MVAFCNVRNAKYWIETLQLLQHPEGGFYSETYRADITIDSCEGTDHRGRSISSTIYYLLEGAQVSMFHRMRDSDEIWHFYSGSSLTIYLIEEATRKLLELKLGCEPQGGEMFQILIKRGSWFGAKVKDSSSYTLAGCTVSPAFTFADFELADRTSLTNMYPEHTNIIKKLTRCP